MNYSAQKKLILLIIVIFIQKKLLEAFFIEKYHYWRYPKPNIAEAS
jgi:hypothetical protein